MKSLNGEIMLSILLMILKVIGWILLSVFLVLLFILLSVLFVPIRYKAIGSKEDDIKGYIKVTWFLHLISIKASYEKHLEYGLKIAGFTLFSDKEKPEKPVRKRKVKKDKIKDKTNIKTKDKTKDKTKEDNEILKTAEILKTDIPSPTVIEPNMDNPDDVKPGIYTLREETIKNAKELYIVEEKEIKQVDKDVDKEVDKVVHKNEFDKKEADETQSENIKAEEYNTKESSNEDPQSQNNPKPLKFFNKIKTLYLKLTEILKNIKFKFQDICDKLKKVGNDVTYYKDLLQSELGTKSVKKVKKSIFKILKSIKPRKLEIALEIGMGDPASTGKILGIAGMLYPVFENHIRITPYFDEEVFRGKIYLRGHITIAVLVIVACKLYFDKNLRAFVRLLKKEEK